MIDILQQDYRLTKPKIYLILNLYTNLFIKMESKIITKMAKELQISPVEIIREEMEIYILNWISQSILCKRIVFKGGTALRLVYGSPRFSQDLDFSLIKKIDFNEFRNLIKKIVSNRNELSLKDIYDKRNTLFALLLVKNQLLNQSFSIKIEISKKKYRLTDKDYQLKAAKSPTSILTPLVYSYSLERILYEKKLAVKTRSEPRDYFDTWWLGEKLGIKIDLKKPGIHRGKFMGEISQLLPNYLKNWPKEFLKKYERS